MKKYTYIACSDAGIIKTINQDSLLIKHIRYQNKEAIIALVCDGVGGLEQGEVASASLVHAFENAWIPSHLSQDIQTMKITWKNFLKTWNEKIRKQSTTMATTCSALLIVNETIWILHVGDSRIYNYSKTLQQLTTDHSKDHKLYECIGYFPSIHPQIEMKSLKASNYLICTDGLYRKLKESELIEGFEQAKTKTQMKRQMQQWMQIVKQRQETDNMSAIWIRVNADD